MFGKRTRNRQQLNRHIIDNGNVGCPRRHADVDIEHCFMCSAFEDLVPEDGVTYLICRGAPVRATAAMAGPSGYRR